MDDLCIKMIANTKKLKASASNDDCLNAATAAYNNSIFQIMQSNYLSKEVVQDHSSEFATFLKKHHDVILALFERSLHVKIE